MFLFTMYAFRTSGNFKYVVIALFICTAFNGLLSILQMTGHDLVQYDWFVNLICDSEMRAKDLTVASQSYYTYGALYNSNYMGSFTGLIIPLFTVMAMYSQKALHRILFIVFDLLAILMLIGSAARSGIVAVAAALVVGIIVFARVIIKHWKPCVIAVVSVAVVLVGANFILKNRLFARIPSLVSDAIGLFIPTSDEDSDLFDKLPLREIDVQNDGTVKLVGQETSVIMGYDKEIKNFTFSNEDGSPASTNSVLTLTEDRFKGFSVHSYYGTSSVWIGAGEAGVLFTINDKGDLVVADKDDNVFNDDNGNSIVSDSSTGTASAEINGNTVYIEYDSNFKRLFLSEYDGGGGVTDLFYYERVRFNDESLKDVSLNIEADNTNIYDRDMVKLNFYTDYGRSLYFKNTNGYVKMIHPVSKTTFMPENAAHIGFEGKEEIGSARGYIWSRTLPLLGNCMLIGYGPDTFTYIFPQNDVLAKYYSYAQFDEGFYVTINKAHNLYLQIFYSSGLIALLAFLGIVVFYLVDCFRLYALKREYRMEQVMGISVMLGIVGYLAAGLFNDSVVSVAPVFWILLGVGAALNIINRRADRNIAVDNDYIPEETVPVPAAADEDKERRTAAAAEILAAAIRTGQDKKQEEHRKRAAESRPSQKDISDLLASVRAIKTVEDKQREAEAAKSAESANPEAEDSDDNS